MSNLILVRHGQSEWNLENRFTGWVDVDLAPKGKLEACKSGELIKQKKLKIDYFFSFINSPALQTSSLPFGARSTSTHPVNLFSRFHSL